MTLYEGRPEITTAPIVDLAPGMYILMGGRQWLKVTGTPQPAKQYSAFWLTPVVDENGIEIEVSLWGDTVDVMSDERVPVPFQPEVMRRRAKRARTRAATLIAQAASADRFADTQELLGHTKDRGSR